MAYTAEGSGGSEVNVRPDPGPEPAVLISGNGSLAPAWSRDGTQLYFRQNFRQTNATNANPRRQVMMVVDIAEGRPSPERLLIDPWPYGSSVPSRSYDVLEDGGFIAGMVEDESSNVRERYRVDELQVVFNFVEVLRQRMAD